MQLASAYKRNTAELATVSKDPVCVYGAISDASRWVFVKYDGQVHVESKEFTLDLDDKDSIAEVIMRLGGILLEQDEAFIKMGFSDAKRIKELKALWEEEEK